MNLILILNCEGYAIFMKAMNEKKNDFFLSQLILYEQEDFYGDKCVIYL